MANDDSLYDVQTTADGPSGALPLTESMLRELPSGDLFGLSQNAGMGWEASATNREGYLILSTLGGIRAPDGRPIALGYHTGHWEIGLMVEAAALAIREADGVPFAGFCSDPCDGRTQGTAGMLDSLPYRNDAAIVLRRLIRSLPTRKGVIGVATCDKGLPAMLMALAGCGDMPVVAVPGGVTLPPRHGEDAGKIQTIGARFSHGLISLQEAADAGCRACATPGGGCQFLGTAASMQVAAEALGLAVSHSALAPSGQPIWRDVAVRSAHAVMQAAKSGLIGRKILTPAAIRNAMTVHAAFGGSTNLILHIPAIAHAAGLPRPTVEDWHDINLRTPRLVDALPNGPVGHPTVRVFLAGGVPEVMLHLRELGLIDGVALTVEGKPVDRVLDEWKNSERRKRLRECLFEADGVDPDEVIFSPAEAKRRAVTGTVAFPRGNIAPQGSVVKATSIDRSQLDDNGVYRKLGKARVFTTEQAAIAALKSHGDDRVQPGEIIVLGCRGPLGSGMEETYQITSALKHLPWGHEIALITDARFSGVSTGPCIGHIGPEALAGGPIGKLLDGDAIEIIIDCRKLEGSVNLVGHGDRIQNAEWGNAELASRQSRADLAPDPRLPDDTKLWAKLQEISGGSWGGCVYDIESILERLNREHCGQPTSNE